VTDPPAILAIVSGEHEVVRRATRFDLLIEQSGQGEYRVVHQGKVVHTSGSRTIADAYFEVILDELQAATGEDPMARIHAEQSFRDILGVRGDASRRRIVGENAKGGKGGRGGT
jgi:hypothetical protein